MATTGGYSDVCVVVPAYNEGSVIRAVVRGLKATFDNVVVVDDGSRDVTSGEATLAGAIVVRHPVNLGQGAALQTGFDYARRAPHIKHVVTFDADGQHRVRDAVTMVDLCRSNDLDVVLGSRRLGATVDQPLMRRLVLAAALVFTRATTHLNVTDTHNGLRVLSCSALEQFSLVNTGMAYASELEMIISQREFTWRECPISIEYTEYSRSKGQPNINAFNILFDLAVSRMRAPS